MSIRVGIMGYGNLGRGIECSLKQNPDMELVAVFTRRDPASVKILSENVNVYHVDDAPKMKDEIDVSECTKYREVKAIVDDWLDYYNNSRYQWQLAKLSPNEYYEYITTGIYPLEGIVSAKENEHIFPMTNK